MATKWHINKKTGKPAECEATVRDCPVGGTHYDSKSEAYNAIKGTLLPSRRRLTL